MTNNKKKNHLILEIKGNSLDDGPGIRSVIFYKGCPLSCVWCHNPESKKPSIEISFDRKNCINCGACRDVCPEKAIHIDNKFYIDRNKCTLCFVCLDSCPSNSLQKVGKLMSVDEIIAKIIPDKPFFDTSDGGVTISGGEPTLNMDNTSKLLKALKKEKIHTLIETCGLFDFEIFMEKLYPYLDSIYFDIKIIDSQIHKKYCGLPNEKILENFKQLYKKAKKDGKYIISRTPLIPNITDTKKNIEEIANFLKKLYIEEAVLLAYNPLWHDKTNKIGVDNPYNNSKVMSTFSEQDVLKNCKNIFLENGIRCK